MSARTDLQIEQLLARLRDGDRSALAGVCRLCEPFLRVVARRHLSSSLRGKLDSQDVVQSVWVRLVRHLEQDGAAVQTAAHLRAYLARALRHRLIDRYRQHRAALEREQHLDSDGQLPPGKEPRPSQSIQAEETWDRIQSLCSPRQAEVVELRRQGLTVEEIAARTQLHPSSVRRIFYDLARRLGLGQQ